MPLAALAALLPQEPDRHISRTGAFSVVLPDRWRQLTPDEAFALSKRSPPVLPPDLLTPTTAAFYPYGEVDRWLAGAFDGRCLTVQQVDGEYPVDDDGVSVIREATAKATDDGWQREIVSTELVELGAAKHPAIQCTVRQVGGRPWPTVVSLLLFVPTAGDTLILGFRTWEEDFEAASAVFQKAAHSMTFARPARGPSKLGDQLLYPALIGALVGLLLLGLRRRPTRPASLVASSGARDTIQPQ